MEDKDLIEEILAEDVLGEDIEADEFSKIDSHEDFAKEILRCEHKIQ